MGIDMREMIRMDTTGCVPSWTIRSCLHGVLAPLEWNLPRGDPRVGTRRAL